MTLSELNQFQAMQGLIEYEKERLKKLRAAAGIKSPIITGMPHANGVHDRIAENIPEAVDLEREIMEHLEEIERRRDLIKAWIEKQPYRIRLIVTLRYIEGLTWNETADEVYRNSASPKSEDAVRKYLIRHLRREEMENGTGNEPE